MKSPVSFALVAIAVFALLVPSFYPIQPVDAQADPFIGQVSIFAGNFAPRSWALCDGQLLAISQNTALFSILGTTYGGDGRTTFGLPDMKGRDWVHPGSGAGLPTVRLGEKAGSWTTTLNINQIPSHTHALRADNQTAPTIDPTVNFPSGNALSSTWTRIYSTGTADVSMDSSSIANAGGSQAHNIKDAYLAMNCIIALQGTFPSRN